MKRDLCKRFFVCYQNYFFEMLNCIKVGELIEEYLEDFPYPSCLIYGHAVDNRIIHVVVGCDEEYAYIITAYIPNLQKFESDLKTRRGC